MGASNTIFYYKAECLDGVDINEVDSIVSTINEKILDCNSAREKLKTTYHSEGILIDGCNYSTTIKSNPELLLKVLKNTHPDLEINTTVYRHSEEDWNNDVSWTNIREYNRINVSF